MSQITALWLAWVEKATRGFDFSCPVDATLNRQVASVETVRAALRISAPRHLLILAALERRRKQPSVACDSGSRTDAFRFAGRGAGTGVLGREICELEKPSLSLVVHRSCRLGWKTVPSSIGVMAVF
jgi:hypothetical protein